MFPKILDQKDPKYLAADKNITSTRHPTRNLNHCLGHHIQVHIKPPVAKPKIIDGCIRNLLSNIYSWTKQIAACNSHRDSWYIVQSYNILLRPRGSQYPLPEQNLDTNTYIGQIQAETLFDRHFSFSLLCLKMPNLMRNMKSCPVLASGSLHWLMF
jgi:hypothetical protein